MRSNFTLVINIPAGGSPINRRSLRLAGILGFRPEYFEKSKSKRVAR